MNFLVDHNLKGHAVLLSGIILSGGWLDWVSIVASEEIGYCFTPSVGKLFDAN